MHVHRSIPAGMVAALMTALLMLLLAPTSALADTTVVVRGDTAAGENLPGWLFNRDESTSTPFEFTTDEASIGGGSVYVAPISDQNASDKFIAELFLLSPLDGLEEITYAIRLGPDSATRTGVAEQFYLNVYTNLPTSDVTDFYDCRFDFTADSISADAFTTISVVPTSMPDHVKSNNDAECGATLADMPEGSTVRVVALNLGDSSTNDAGLDGYFDNVVVTQNGDATTYDFEATPPDKDACKRGGFVSYGFANQGQCVSFVTSNGNRN